MLFCWPGSGGCHNQLNHSKAWHPFPSAQPCELVWLLLCFLSLSFSSHFLPSFPFASLPINFPALAQFFSPVNFPTWLPFHSFPLPPSYLTPFLSFPQFTPLPHSISFPFFVHPYPSPFLSVSFSTFLPHSLSFPSLVHPLPHSISFPFLSTPTPLPFSPFPCPPPAPLPFFPFPSLSFLFLPFLFNFPNPGWVLWILNVGDDQRAIFGLKFLIPGYFWVGKFCKYLFRWLDLSREDFFAYSKQSEDPW